MNAHVARSVPHRRFARLSDPRLLREDAYIGGRWVAGAARFAVTDPADGEALAHVASLGAEAADRAVEAAAAAFPIWADLPPEARSAALLRWHDAILAAREDLAAIMVLEQGKPLAEARGEIDYAASFVRFYAGEAQRVCVEGVASHLPDAEMRLTRRPVGVAGLVTPWNFPSAMLTRKATAALAAGCTAVAHPSSHTPLSALALAVLAERAGLPEGVFNVVTGEADAIVGRLCADARVRAMSFTGSTEVGRLIAARSAPTMKRLVMELGGHAPLIAFADAGVERAAAMAVAAKFATSGQDCLAANRIYVERPAYAAFADAFVRRTQALKVAAGFAEGAEIGPLMHERAVAKCAAHVADALARGARLLCGGSGHAAGPLFFQPTVLADVPPDAAIMREETFGPVAALAPFDTEAEALARANDTEYGLVAYLSTADAARAARMSARLDYGMVAVNRVKITGAPVPFGGTKQSGLGREGSRHGLEAFTDIQYVCLDRG
ncbi:NAD-dependent succinate-semialdehyde dehydrogenase [Aureimonas flava]|uniref:NAD-dependent succinate-semialdehyde dehydrogenase n=1 Tax=Aureimonas flava TaxID=2320271 RepID=A0A3A1WW91_9HYPH|nr:NAD-dependent succinate-semialdehyde dehydrogenase [Aureimonas flava]RIY02638.1 NAD-dependent succinate-semialdehyde dehydrogenase [Aureimonas flava]